MKCSLLLSYGGTLTTALLLLSAAHADLIQWSYTTRVDTTVAFPGLPTKDGNGAILSVDAEQSASIFLGWSSTNGSYTPVTGSATIQAASVGMTAASGPASPEMFAAPFNTYKLTVFMRDLASHASGSVSFTGSFQGQISPEDSSGVTQTFTGPLTEAITLGQNRYTVNIGPYSPPPGLPNSNTQGSIRAHVDVEPAGVSNTPEPSTLVLSALGLPCFGLLCWLGWRGGRQVVVRLT